MLVFYLHTTKAQQLPEVVKDKVHVNGSLSATSIGYHVRGIESRRDPFYWAISGNLNIQLGELSLPFSVTFNAQEAKFTRPQPFNQFGVSPKYKWIRAHLGYRTLQFSELTLAGNMFFGIGVELTPTTLPLEFRAMYGRFSRAITPENSSFFNASPSYERWGYGTKITLKREESILDIIAFKAKDDKYSLDTSVATAYGLAPSENFITGLSFHTKIKQRIFFDLQYALSAYTSDVRTDELVLDSYTYLNNLGGLYTPRASTQVNSAVIAKVGYSGQSFTSDISYRRISPDYKTMGSTFLNNDLRDITLNVSKPLFNNKLQVNAGGGVQQNNLDKSKQSRMVRLVGTTNCTFVPSSNFSFNANYANFSTRTTQSVFVDNTLDQIDSLFYLQVTNNVGFSANYNPGKHQSRTNLILSTNYQKARDNTSGSSEFYNINIADQMTFTEQKLSINTGLNFSKNTASTYNQIMAGPAVSVVKSVQDVRMVFSSSWQHAFTDDNLKSRLFNARINCNYTFKKKHVFSADLSYLSRQAMDEGIPSFHEWRGGLTYRYTFDIL